MSPSGNASLKVSRSTSGFECLHLEAKDAFSLGQTGGISGGTEFSEFEAKGVRWKNFLPPKKFAQEAHVILLIKIGRIFS